MNFSTPKALKREHVVHELKNYVPLMMIQWAINTALLFILGMGAIEVLKTNMPTAYWFSVHNVSVPDFSLRTDPLLTYNRTIKQPFIATWVVELQKHGIGDEWMDVCSNSSMSNYSPHNALPQEGVRLSWYMGKDCSPTLTRGTYRLVTSWVLYIDDFPNKTTTKKSNTFEVY